MRMHALCLAALFCVACDGATANQPQPSGPAPGDQAQPPDQPAPTGPAQAPTDSASGDEPDEPDEPDASPEDAKRCGGIAGFKCPEAMRCVDDPNDDCSPKKGGADCMGMCVPDDCDQAGRAYRSREPSKCALIKFGCGEGLSHFSDSCGCGCLNPAT